MKKILLVEDDDSIIKGLLYSLEKLYLVEVVKTKKELELISSNTFDIAILDIGLSDGSSLDVCCKLSCPIIFLTCYDDEDIVEKGLSFGEDYMKKPFSTNELLIRVDKILKRESREVIYYKDLAIDKNLFKVFKLDKEIVFSSLEFFIVELLFSNINRVITREVILDLILEKNGKFVEDNTLTVYIKRIREKLGVDYIRTINKVGYIIDEK